MSWGSSHDWSSSGWIWGVEEGKVRTAVTGCSPSSEGAMAMHGDLPWMMNQLRAYGMLLEGRPTCWHYVGCLPDWEENEAFLIHLEEVSCSQTLVLLGDSN